MIMTLTQKQQSSQMIVTHETERLDGEVLLRSAIDEHRVFTVGFPSYHEQCFDDFWSVLVVLGVTHFQKSPDIPMKLYIRIYIYIYLFFLPMIIMIRLTTTMIVNSNIIYQQWWCDMKQTRIIKSVWSQDDLTFSPSKPSRKARSLALMPPNSRENYWMPARMMRSENHRCGWRKSCTSW